MAAYSTMMAQDNREQIGRLKRNLTHALRQDITPRQREYMMLYYGQNLSMEAIAQKLGVNKSTVSRTLKRGRQRLYRCLRYGAANLLEQADS
ncbi:MAG TPA: sigma-70 family RNA polymerase sigma factor [Candidatus Enterenecus merdae]|nr:sigma-70 family RNA polymerase sigma factor [Candidatus Enterenecus merdae]